MKKNIVQIVPDISFEASGPSYSVRRLSEEMHLRFNATLAILKFQNVKKIKVRLKVFPISFGPKRLGRSKLMYQWLSKCAKNNEFDLIHNNGLWMMPTLYSGLISKRFNIPLVMSPRGALSKKAFSSGSFIKVLFWFFQKNALHQSACFHATSFQEYEDIRRFGFSQPVAIIPNGIDIKKINKSKDSNSNKKTLLFIGRIHPIKGLEILLNAWQKVQDQFPEWSLKIAGPDSKFLVKLVDLSANLKLERVNFVGPLYGDKKWEAYQDSDIFVLPTYSENFGMTVAESLSVGTPVIVSKGAPC